MSVQRNASKTAPTPCITLSVDLRHGAVLAVKISGELDIASVVALEDAMRPYQGLHTSVSYDLADVNFIDCAGLRALLAPADGDPFSSVVSMTRASRCVRRLLELLQLQSSISTACRATQLDSIEA